MPATYKRAATKEIKWTKRKLSSREADWRDELAARAMVELMRATALYSAQTIASNAYAMADAMMGKREEGK